MSQALQRNAEATPNQQLAVRSGTFIDSSVVTSMLADAAEKCILISPVTACPSLPEGCEVVFSTLLLNPTPGAGDVYAQGGNVALTKSALDRIASLIGVSWDMNLSRRTDDRKDPRYCEYQAVGTYQDFDGSTKTISGTKEMDLRDGSEAAKTLSAGELSMQRKHIVAHAETKAKLRAVRSHGVRSSYSKTEIAKPFVVVKMMFTGRTQDPELRRAFALRNMERMTGATHSLYGRGLEAVPAALPPAEIDDEPDVTAHVDGSIQGEIVDLSGEPGDEPQDAYIPPPVEARPSNGLLKIGKHKDKKYSDQSVPMDYLVWLEERYVKEIADETKAPYLAANNGELNAIRDEISRRKS